jgi:hypothetical protein
LSCTVQVANHRKAIGLLHAGVQTAANAGVPQDFHDVPVVSVPQLGQAVTDRSAWDGVH